MKFVTEWRTVLWRSATSWVAGALGAVVGVVSVNWMILLGVLPFMPFYIQLPVALAVGILAIWGPTMVARLVEQPKMQEKIEAKHDLAA